MGLVSTVLASSSERRVHELTELDAAVRGPLPLSTRVAFVGVAGGLGTSVAAGLAASVLRARRSSRVLAVNTSPGRTSVLWHLGVTERATPVANDAATRAGARHADEATAGLSRTPGGIYAADLADESGTADARWWDTVAPIARFFDFVVTDWGVRTPHTLGDVVAASSLVCVTAAADLTSVQHGVDLAHTAESAGSRPVLVVVDAQARMNPALREAVRGAPVPAVSIPHDAVHAHDRPVPSRRLSSTTNLAALRLAATLVQRAGGSV